MMSNGTNGALGSVDRSLMNKMIQGDNISFLETNKQMGNVKKDTKSFIKAEGAS